MTRTCRHCGGVGTVDGPPTVPDLVWDTLQTWVWQTSDDVVRRIHRNHPDIPTNSVRVALSRMAKTGEIIAEPVDGRDVSTSGVPNMYRRPARRRAETTP